MRRRFLKAMLALATMLVVWLVVSPATATTTRSAPVCDPRGAVGFAPPPQIQDLEVSLDIPVDCFDLSGLNPLETKNIVPGGHGSEIDFSSAQEPIAVTTPVVLDLAFTERQPIRFSTSARPPPGVKTALDRPPRK